MWFVFVAAGFWILQGILGLWQMKHFHERFRRIRREGRVVVGRAKGRIMAGVVVLFCIDETGTIRRGEKMEGFSVFARLQSFADFNTVNITKIDERACAGLDKQTAQAVRNAVENYQAFCKTTEMKKVELKNVTV